ncbi:MAG: A/G-specific adenine glycosylase [Myxococcota bacterium]
MREAAIGNALVEWYRNGHRDLPWRRTRDPYRIWISEIMCQQTQVDTVVPRYERFVERFPDVRALAAVKEETVCEEWAGLGYYSRARNLHRAACSVVREHDGKMPSNADDLQKLPGIGRYTAGAIASIAFDEATPVVDGNVGRVLSRVYRLAAVPTSSPGQKVLWGKAQDLVPAGAPGDFNQALMELGALVCTPKSPTCMLCPIRAHFDAYCEGDV